MAITQQQRAKNVAAELKRRNISSATAQKTVSGIQQASKLGGSSSAITSGVRKGLGIPKTTSGVSQPKAPVQPKTPTNARGSGVGTATSATRERPTSPASQTAPTQAQTTQQPKPFTEKEVFGNEALTMGEGYMDRRNASIAQELSSKYKTDAEIQRALADRLSPGVKAGEGITMPNVGNTYNNIYEQIKKLQEGQGQAPTGELPPAGGTTPEAMPGEPQAPTATKTEGILGYNRLDPEYQALIDQMSPQDKKTLDAIAGNDLNRQAEYLRQFKREKEYSDAQKGIKDTMTGIEGETLAIQRSQRIQQAQDGLRNLKQNVAYLGSQGMPGKSSEKLDAVARQIDRAEQAYGQMQKVETNADTLRTLGIEMDSKQYEKQMADMQEDLNRNVNQEVQNALNDMSAADMAGELDTIEGVQAFKKSLLEKLDSKISGYTEGSMKQMQYITEKNWEMAQQAEQRVKEYNKNKQTVNQEMSAIQGFYVDGNGDPLVSATTGTVIQMPEQPPMEPVFDTQTGNMIQFETDENGQIVAKVDKVMQGVQDYKNFQAQQANQFKMQQMGAQQQFEMQKAGATAQQKTVKTDQGVYAFNPQTGQYDQPVGVGGSGQTQGQIGVEARSSLNFSDNIVTSDGNQISMAQLVTADKATKNKAITDYARQNLGMNYKLGGGASKTGEKGAIDCSGFVTSFGVAMGVISDTDSKMKYNAATMLRESQEMGLEKPVSDVGEGDLVYYKNPSGKISHVAIVAGPIGEDGTMTILDSSGQRGTKERQIKVGPDGKLVGGESEIVAAENFMNYLPPIEQPQAKDEQPIQVQEEYAPYYNKALQGKLTTADYKAIESAGIDVPTFQKQAFEYKKQQDVKITPLANEFISLLKELKGMDGLDYQNMRVGVPGTKGRDYRKTFDRVKSNAALQQLINLKSQGATFGALSDNELKFIADSATELDMWSTRGKFDKTIDGLIQKLEKGVGSVEKEMEGQEQLAGQEEVQEDYSQYILPGITDGGTSTYKPSFNF